MGRYVSCKHVAVLMAFSLLLTPARMRGNHWLSNFVILLATERRDPAPPLIASTRDATMKVIAECSIGLADRVVSKWVHDRFRVVAPGVADVVVAVNKKEGMELWSTYYLSSRYKATHTVMIDTDLYCQLYDHLRAGHICNEECQNAINEIAARMDRAAGAAQNAFCAKVPGVVCVGTIGALFGGALLLVGERYYRALGALLVAVSLWSVRSLFCKWTRELDACVEDSSEILRAFKKRLEGMRGTFSNHWLYSWTKCPLLSERIELVDDRIAAIEGKCL